MILTVQVKLLPDKAQAKALRETVELVNAAANRLSGLAWTEKEFRQFPLHRRFYRQIRDEFPLTAQVVVRLVAKIAHAYKPSATALRVFRKHGSISYDCRILDIHLSTSTVSIWALGGRLKNLPFVCGEAQRRLLGYPHGETDLILRNNTWFLNVSVDVPDEHEYRAVGWLGIDVGLVNLATSSDGETFGQAKKLAGIRDRRWRQRKRLQSKCSRSAKRVLRGLRGRERRFVATENHRISREIVAQAKRTTRGIALEELTHIRSRIRARKSLRRLLHSWAFADLQNKIAYKGRLFGVPVLFVDARNSSRTCTACGHINKKNRVTRDLFACKACGFTADADTNAACEIARRALVNAPNERDGVRAHVQNLAVICAG